MNKFKNTTFIVIFIATLLVLLLICPKSPPENMQEKLSISNLISKEKEVLSEFNLVKSKIKSLKIEKLEMQINRINFTFSAYYEKPLNFRMINSSKRKDFDIGSNKDLFWFWCSFMKPNALFYSSHENTNKTYLKTALHPKWFMELMDISEINLENKSFLKYDNDNNKVVVLEKTHGQKERPIYKIVFIDLNKNCIFSHYICDENLNIIISAEVVEFQNVNGFQLPKKIKTKWHEENNLVSYIDFSSCDLNSNIDSSNFTIPDKKNSINLIDYVP